MRRIIYLLNFTIVMTEKIKLMVTGMHCASCEMLITDCLDDLGLKNISINHETGNLSFDENSNVNIELIKKSIKAEGFNLK